MMHMLMPAKSKAENYRGGEVVALLLVYIIILCAANVSSCAWLGSYWHRQLRYMHNYVAMH